MDLQRTVIFLYKLSKMHDQGEDRLEGGRKKVSGEANSARVGNTTEKLVTPHQKKGDLGLKAINDKADNWRKLGCNVYPGQAGRKGARDTNIKLYFDKPIPLDLHDLWKKEGAFFGGLCVIMGRTWHFETMTPKNYVLCIDADKENKGAIEWVGQNLPPTYTEWHEDPDSMHFFYFSKVPIEPISAKQVVSGRGAVEVITKNHTVNVAPGIHPESGKPYSCKFFRPFHTFEQAPNFKKRIAEGSRNESFHKQSIRTINKHPKLSKEALVAEMLVWNQNNCSPPLDEQECRSTFNSAWSFCESSREEKEEPEPPVAITPELVRETTFKEVTDILSTTIKQDDEAKTITFAGMLLAQTNEDQVNIAFQQESCAGKSYIPMEVGSYFSEKEVMPLAGASPTSFFHENGEWNEETREQVVDLEGKIIIFLDQPHFLLLQKLRSFLAHDKKELRYKITDKSKSGKNRTKTVVLRGFAAVVFCTANFESDEQEQTRMIFLSPSVSQEKLEASLALITRSQANKKKFQEELEKEHGRIWLKSRIKAIRQSGIREVVIPNEEEILKRFRAQHEHLVARHQRDYKRVFAMIKAHALLNCFTRTKENDTTILAAQDDIEAGFAIYGKVAESNERGLSPHVYNVWEQVLKPLLEIGGGVDRKEVSNKYYAVFHKFASPDTISKIISQLETCGLVKQEEDPDNKKRKLLYSNGVHNPQKTVFKPTPVGTGDTSHQKTTICETPYLLPKECEVCDGKFGTEKEYFRHLREAHTEAGE